MADMFGEGEAPVSDPRTTSRVRRSLGKGRGSQTVQGGGSPRGWVATPATPPHLHSRTQDAERAHVRTPRYAVPRGRTRNSPWRIVL